jgi:transposase-like protein
VTDTGKLDLQIPRDRQASFDPQLIAKYQRRFPGFDDKVISMYARGLPPEKWSSLKYGFQAEWRTRE